MIRALVLVVFGVMILGTSCPGDFCANDVTSTHFSFSLTIPSEFQCTNVFPNATVLAQGRWYKSAPLRIVSVMVAAPSDEDDPGDGFTIEDLGETTNAHGITFELKKVTLQSQGQGSVSSYVAAATLPGGNVLSITVAPFTVDDALPATLNTIIETVQWLE